MKRHWVYRKVADLLIRYHCLGFEHFKQSQFGLGCHYHGIMIIAEPNAADPGKAIAFAIN